MTLAQILATRRHSAFPAGAALELIRLLPTGVGPYVDNLTLLTDWLSPIGSMASQNRASDALVNLCFSWRILAIEERTGINRAQILAYFVQKEYHSSA